MPLDVVLVLAAALVVVLVLHRLRLPVIAGFLVAGALIGPSGLRLVTDTERIEQLAEIGVVLLLFTIGLEFSLARLRRIARAVLVGGSLQVGLTGVAALLVALAWGEPLERGVFLGFLVALSSTAIVLRGLTERDELAAPHGRFILGILLFQDFCVVPMMLVVPMLATRTATFGAVLGALALAVGVMVVTLILARYLVPFVFARVARTRRRDLFLLAALLTCAGIAWATQQVGLSLALGAFLAGLVLADSEYGHQALADVLPLRDLFTSLFFVSLGMLLDVRILLESPGPVLGLCAALLAGKFLVVVLVGWLMRLPLRVVVLSGVALAQVGEFSFVLAGLGRGLGLVSARDLSVFLDASVLTMLVTPLLLRAGPHLAAGARRLAGLERVFGPAEIPAPERDAPLDGHVVILGYGLGGRLLAESLRAANVPRLVVELDPDRVRRARDDGEHAAYGDATSPDVLEAAHVARASHVAVLLNDPDASARAVRAVRRLSRDVPITARGRFLDDLPLLVAAGATHAVAQEVEASLELVHYVLVAAHLEPGPASAIVAAERASLAPGGRG
ncbi:MAG: cation:proton antiporter [Planctomycetes bacterium]|nr:cation:proton antiporter [Planctomycetota bacterium]